MADETLAAEKETVVITEKEAPQEPSAPTREQLKANGWTADEMQRAEKRGMLPKAAEPEKKPEPKPEAAKPEEGKKDEPAKPSVKAKGVLPNFDMTPEQEKVFLDTFGPGAAPRALYFRMKNERHSRQAAEARARELETENRVLKEGKGGPQAGQDEGALGDEDQPLTVKQLRAMQEAEAIKLAKAQQDHGERAARVSSATAEHEEYAKSVYPDFEDTVTLAKEVVQNIDTMFPEKWKQAKVVNLLRAMQVAAANSDKIGLDEYTAAHIAYELGQMHPQYGKAKPDGQQDKETGTSKEDPTVNGGLTPEQMKKIEVNTQRRASSAALSGGGGKRTIAAGDVDLATLNKMDFAQRKSFREKHPDRYAKLLRG